MKVTVMRVEPIGRQRFKIKIAETGVNLAAIEHKGRLLEVSSKLGRGRYIMRDTGPVVAKMVNRGVR
jgi:hypothetical protein